MQRFFFNKYILYIQNGTRNYASSRGREMSDKKRRKKKKKGLLFRSSYSKVERNLETRRIQFSTSERSPLYNVSSCSPTKLSDRFEPRRFIQVSSSFHLEFLASCFPTETGSPNEGQTNERSVWRSVVCGSIEIRAQRVAPTRTHVHTQKA